MSPSLRWALAASVAAVASGFLPRTPAPLSHVPRLGAAQRVDAARPFPPHQRSRSVTMLEPVSPGGFNSAGKPPVEIRGFSLAKAVLGSGLGLTVASLAQFFFTEGSGSVLEVAGFIYGIPVTLIGCSLAYAELEPAGMSASPSAEARFETKATTTMKDIKSDVTRHRYGDEAHLDTTVKALGLVLSQKEYPQLQYIEIENADNDEVSMTMVFQSLDTPFRLWAEEDRIKKFDTFFGPGLYSEVIKVSSEDKMVGIKLTTGARPAAAAPAPAPVSEAAPVE